MTFVLHRNIADWLCGVWQRLTRRGGGDAADCAVGLSAQQVKVLQLDSGRHVVFAAPGTGKTELLVRRMRRALNAGIPHEQMACLTFTNRAARSMRERAGALTEKVFVGNFHSYAALFLKTRGRLGYGRGIIDEHDALELLKEAVGIVFAAFVAEDAPGSGMAQGTVKDYREAVMATAQHYFQVGNMRRLKCPGRVIVSYQELLDCKIAGGRWSRRQNPVSREVLERLLGEVEREYRAIKKALAVMDFDELLAECLGYLCREQAVPQVGAYQWIQVDEAQDLNECQWELLHRMLAPGGHLVVFADREQAIYSFMGASSRSLNEAVRQMRVHDLQLNYRSPAQLLRVFTTYAREELKVRPTWRTALNVPHNPLALGRLESVTADDERRAICRYIVPKMLQDGAKSVAVLLRTNQQAAAMSNALERAKLRHFKVSAEDVFHYAVTRDFMDWLHVLADPRQRLPWVRVLKKAAHIKTFKEARRMVNDLTANHLLPHWLFSCGGEAERCAPLRLLRWLEKGRLVLFDTETTGTDIGQDDIVQFAAVELIDGVPGRELNLFLQTDRSLDASQAVHGITQEKLRQTGLSRDEALRQICAFLGDSAVVAHNLPFDARMLEANLRRAGLAGMRAGSGEGFCTLELARALDRDAPSHRLRDLLARYRLSGVNSHDALDDVRATVNLLLYLRDRLAEQEEPMRQACMRHGNTFAKALQRVGERLAMHWDNWCEEVDFQSLFDEFLALDDPAYYEEEHVLEVRRKLLRHMTHCVERQPLYRLLDEPLRAYRLYRESDLIMPEDRLVVSTVHRAKGLEFDSVVVAQVHDRNFPSFFSITKEAKMEDARCLYVAMTRARRQLVVSWPKNNDNGYPVGPSPFLRAVAPLFPEINVPGGSGRAASRRG
jgi:DNA helicase-2/ATP-dependent DNA helicase PcrA